MNLNILFRMYGMGLLTPILNITVKTTARLVIILT